MAASVDRLWKSLYSVTHNRVYCVAKNYGQHAKEMGG